MVEGDVRRSTCTSGWRMVYVVQNAHGMGSERKDERGHVRLCTCGGGLWALHMHNGGGELYTGSWWMRGKCRFIVIEIC